MRAGLMESAMQQGIYLDAKESAGRFTQGIGAPWFPPRDIPLIHCQAIYDMAHSASDGTAVAVAAFRSDGQQRDEASVAQDILRARRVQSQSHLEQLLTAFDDGEEEHNPPMLCPFEHAWLEFASDKTCAIRAATMVSDADVIGHVNAWHVVQVGSGPITMIGSARYWNGGRERSTQLSPAGNKMAARLLTFLDEHAEAYAFSPPDITGLRPGAHGDAIADHVIDDLRLRTATCGAIRIPNTRGVNVEPVDIRVGKKQKRLRPHQQIRQHVLTITGSEGGSRRNAARGNGQQLTAEHLVRAHWVCYSEESPMFGIPGRHGWWRRQSHKRGKRTNGIVNQTRRIEPA
jgi:hypothetical protein